MYKRMQLMAEQNGLSVHFALNGPDTSPAVLFRARDLAIQRAKVVLSIQFYPEGDLAAHRVAYLVAMGKAVVCERGRDEALNEAISAGVLLADYDDIPKLAIELVQDPPRREALESAAYGVGVAAVRAAPTKVMEALNELPVVLEAG
ncbi:unnamed protein product [Chrysoparadoxa australica]